MPCRRAGNDRSGRRYRDPQRAAVSDPARPPRDAESDQARTLQLISTLLALVGIIAAVIITRQITGPLRGTLAVVERIRQRRPVPGRQSHSPR